MKCTKNTSFLILLLGIVCTVYACGLTMKPSPKEQAQKTEQASPKQAVAPIQFIENAPFDSIRMLAAKEGKIIFADFHADWCKPCKEMEQKVFTDPAVANYFNKHFINYKINIKTPLGKQLKSQYRVYDYPSLLFIDATGETQLTSIGYIDAPMLLEFGKDVNPL